MDVKEGMAVLFDTGDVYGVGKVRGISTIAQPVIGRGIIIEIVKSNVEWKDYPFSHFSCFEHQIKDLGDIVSTKESIHEFDCKEEVKNKVKELLSL
jgi:hypothetical protein